MNAGSIHATKVERLVSALERGLSAVEYVALYGYPSGKQTQLARIELGSVAARWALLDDGPADEDDTPSDREVVEAVVQRVIDVGTQRLNEAPDVARGDGVARARVRVIAYGPKAVEKQWSRIVWLERLLPVVTPQEELASWAHPLELPPGLADEPSMQALQALAPMYLQLGSVTQQHMGLVLEFDRQVMRQMQEALDQREAQVCDLQVLNAERERQMMERARAAEEQAAERRAKAEVWEKALAKGDKVLTLLNQAAGVSPAMEPLLEAVGAHPELLALLQDPAFQELLGNPKLQAMLADPEKRAQVLAMLGGLAG